MAEISDRVKKMQEGKLKAKLAREQMETNVGKEVETKTIRKEVDRPVRKSRKAFGSAQSKLSVPYLIPGYHLHWVNDIPGRIAEAEENDYEFVTYEEVKMSARVATASGGTLGSNVSRLVGKQEDGITPLFAYLMKIRQEWYDEDQKLNQQKVDDVDAAIRGGNVEGHVGRDGRYIPKGGIKYD